MGSKILIITGSPRKDGNTNKMADAFAKAARSKGHVVERFDSTTGTYTGCHACATCYKTGKPCSFDDDFNKVAPLILEADVLVFAMPVYWYSIPSQIKAMIDKLFSLVIGGKDTSGKKCVLISCCEENDITVFDGVRLPMERTAAYLKWDMVGEILVPGVTNIGDIDRTDGCAKAAAIADRI